MNSSFSPTGMSADMLNWEYFGRLSWFLIYTMDREKARDIGYYIIQLLSGREYFRRYPDKMSKADG